MKVQFEKKFDQVDLRLNKSDDDVLVVDLTIEGHANVLKYNYGEDADGNRGVEMVDVEDLEFDDITAFTEDGTFIKVTEDMIDRQELARIVYACEDACREY